MRAPPVLWIVAVIAPACAAPQAIANPSSVTIPSVDDILTFAPGVSGGTVVGRGFAVGAVSVLADARVPESACTRFDVGVAPGIEDVDLSVYDEAGRPVAVDDGEGRFATAVVCTALAQQVHVRAVVARGAGELAIVTSPVERDALRHLGLPDRAIAIPASNAGDALRLRVVGDLGRRGYRIEAGPLAVTLEPDVPMHIGIPARSGDCVAVVARAEAGEAAMRLVSDDGTVVSDDAGRERDLSVGFCSVAGQPLSAVLTSANPVHAHVVVVRGLTREVGGAASVAVGRPGVRP